MGDWNTRGWNMGDWNMGDWNMRGWNTRGWNKIGWNITFLERFIKPIEWSLSYQYFYYSKILSFKEKTFVTAKKLI